MAEFDPSKAAEGFLKQRERSIAETDKESAQAAAVAEMLGYYTPELQQKVTQPLGYNATVGENLLGLPIRGLGKVFGNEYMQQFGTSQPFDLGQAQPQYQPQMPSFPKGTDPETRQMLEQMGLEMGFSPAGKEQVIPNVPSEVMGKPRLRTNREYKQEAEQREQVWKLITDNYQTDQQRRKVEAEIKADLARADLNRSMALESADRVRRGPTANEWSLFEKYYNADNEERIARGEQPRSFSDAYKEMMIMRRNPTKPASKAAKVQWYELSQQHGFEGTPLDFDTMLEKMKWNPLAVAMQVVYGKDSDIPYRDEFIDNPQALNDFIHELARQYMDISRQMNQEMIAQGQEDLFPDLTEIPEDLKLLGLTDEYLDEYMQKAKNAGAPFPSRAAAIQSIKTFQDQQKELRK